jgi:hypothetical protein
MPVVGTLTRLTADTVSIRPDRRAAPIAVARPLVVHVESSEGMGTGRRGPAAWRGAAIAGLAGGLLGIIVGDMSKRNAPKLGFYGAIGGGLGGAVVGASLPGEAWHDATLPSPTH